MTKQEFLAMSLPYGLYLGQHRGGLIESYKYYGLKFSSYSDEWITYIDDKEHGDYQSSYEKGIYPILRPFSDLTKEIEHEGEKFVPLRRLLQNNYFDLTQMSEQDVLSYEKAYTMPEIITLCDLLLYLKWHFDIAGLIEKGEAIDVNTLDENPYK